MNYKLSKYIVLSSSTVNKGNYRILYSSRSTQIHLIQEKTIQSLLHDEFQKIPSAIIKKLINAEVLIDENENEVETIIARNNDAILNKETLYFSILPTAQCQLGCGYCGQSHTKNFLNENLYPSILKRVADKIINSNYKKLLVGWFGAEPLLGLSHIRKLTPQFKDIANVYGLGYSSTIVTNGLSLKVAVFKELAELGVKKIEVTLDGTAKYHDERRHTKGNKKTFDVIFNNLLSILNLPDFEEYGVAITIRCNVDSNNHTGVNELIDLLQAHNLQDKIRFYLAPIHSWGNEAHLVSLEKQEFAAREIEWYIALIQKGFNIGGIIPFETKKVVCMALDRDAELIDAFGNVYNCSEIPYVPNVEQSSKYLLGNLRLGEKSFTEERPLSSWYEDVKNEAFPCSDCRILPICGGACPKSWYDEINPCPSIKFNIDDRLLLHYAREAKLIKKEVSL